MSTLIAPLPEARQCRSGDTLPPRGDHHDARSCRSRRRFRVLVQAALLASPIALGAATVRIIQTNSAGDNIHLIDPVTNKVVAVIDGIEVNHGAAGAPDGSAFYFSNEADHSLDFVDVKTLKVTKKVKLSGRPNNVAISSDGSHVYVAIRQEPGAVDVVDTRSARLIKSVATGGSVHNPFVTPDGKYVDRRPHRSSKKLVVIDGKTEEPVWTMNFDRGVRPIAFEQNADGSTRRMFVQLSDFHGFAVVDFAERKEVTPHRSSRRTARGAPSAGTAGLSLSRYRRRARRQDAVDQQQDEQLRLRVLPARSHDARGSARGRSPGLADLRARRQVTLRGECGVEFGVGGRCRRATGGDTNPSWPGAKAQRHGGPALVSAADALTPISTRTIIAPA